MRKAATVDRLTPRRLLRSSIARQMIDQELHLVGEDVAVGQDQVLDPARPVRYRQHDQHAVTTLAQMSRPPFDTGMT